MQKRPLWGFLTRSVAAALLLPSKVDLLQKLERLECEIEKYDKELKLLLQRVTFPLRTNYLEADQDRSLETALKQVTKAITIDARLL
jgi:hypothetical protein